MPLEQLQWSYCQYCNEDIKIFIILNVQYCLFGLSTAPYLALCGLSTGKGGRADIIGN